MKLPVRGVSDANSLSFPRYADVAHTRLLFEPLPEGFIVGRRLDDDKGPLVGDHATTSQAKEKDRCQELGPFHRAPLSLWSTDKDKLPGSPQGRGVARNKNAAPVVVQRLVRHLDYPAGRRSHSSKCARPPGAPWNGMSPRYWVQTSHRSGTCLA
jgi:hypothetical protein